MVRAGTVASAAADPAPPPTAPPPTARGDAAGALNAVEEEGRYLVDHVYACSGCHTPRLSDDAYDSTRYLAGVECLFDVDPAPGRGCINSKNLTNHARGLLNVTDDEAIERMFLEGIRPDGKPLHPVMPYYEFRNMPKAHATAIVRYLRTVRGIDHLVPPSEPPFDSPPAAPTPPVDLELIPKVPLEARNRASASRGRLLAATACLGCHTPSAATPAPRSPPLDFAKAFAGGRRFRAFALRYASPPQPEVVWSQNLTQHATGILGWNAADIVRVLKQGLDREGHGVCKPMLGGTARAFGGLRDGDALDIANYLLTLKGVDNAVPAECKEPAPANGSTSTSRTPRRLSETGLYAERGSLALAPDVMTFRPRFELWSDGAEKRRFIALPAGATIDARDPDHWRFPVGTRVWKEFRRAGRALETRFIERTGPGANDYFMGAFVWDKDGSDAVFRADGVRDVANTNHDVPAQSACPACHGGEPGRILGFSALQLPRSALDALIANERVAPVPALPFGIAGTQPELAALGYLHANCGHCHGPTGLAYRDVDLDLRLRVADRDVASTAAYRTAVGARAARPFPNAPRRVAPGSPETSTLFLRLTTDALHQRMPPLGTEMRDEAGTALIANWIRKATR